MDKKLTNKAWEPKVGEWYWNIGETMSGTEPAGGISYWPRIREMNDRVYSAHKRDSNVFRTREQAREVLAHIKLDLKWYPEHGFIGQERKAR